MYIHLIIHNVVFNTNRFEKFHISLTRSIKQRFYSNEMDSKLFYIDKLMP